ncbi:hypothetical protein BC941DRAFT_429732 [Chlamydoabsidia padenii]|nr:hypothetical protein BC941DRAFT_429732 [Chlamydoabsidia padenii]
MVSSDPNTVFAYGGKLNSTPNYTPSNLLKLDLTTVPGKWAVLPSGPGAPPISRYGHAMTIRNNIIYFFGGFLNLPETKLQPNIVPLFNVSWYNTLTDQWGTNMATGDNPAGRKYHTATLIGNTSSVLIYGGTGLANLQALPLLDYIYIYDLDEHKYTKVKPDGGGPGARIGHSAIFYQNKVIISFGYDGSGNILNDSHILDVSQPYTPSWINDNNNNNTNSTDPGSNRHSTSLATGAVVGIVIGVVAIVAIMGILAFLFYKKRHHRHDDPFDSYVPPPQDFNIEFPPTMFPDNNDHNKGNHIDNSSGLQQGSVDPAPSYPPAKPHQVFPTTKPHEDVPARPSTVKPLGSD